MTINDVNSFVLTDILDKFIEYLVIIPKNLKIPSVAMLILLLTLDLTLMGKKLITDENFNPVKYLINKTWQFSYLIFVILNYTWITESLREGFQKVASTATGITINSIYINDPSGLIDLGGELAWGVISKGVGLNPISWSYLLIALLILIAFCMIGFGLVMTWIEYYFLIGISIIFVPFGILDTTEGYYKNIFKTIIGCNIKIFVMEFWLLLCEPIISNLEVSKKFVDIFNVIPISITLLVLGLILLSLPKLASSILTGSPAMSAGATLGSAIGGLAMATRNLSRTFGTVQNVAGGALQTGGEGAKETVLGSMKGAKRGGEMGAKLGSVFGPMGTALGGAIGTAAGATVGGAYSGAKFATKKTAGAVKTAVTGKNNGSGTTKQEAVKNNITAAKSPAKEISAENNKGITATTGETRNNVSSGKEEEQGGTTAVSSADTGVERKETSNVSESDPGTETDKSSKTISTGETRNSVSDASNDGKKQNITSGSNTSVETKADTGEVRQGTAETKQSIGEIKEPKYNFYDTGGTTKLNGVDINEKKKK
ncbi:type IV secretion system protein [Fusobacterium varium]|uniref:type IV secretion system protein n=1 Tax=Fusobacterium varium TaxID=856 RepID=UPI001F261EED|nr:type IV secretion system protein [Fusobacterium varium]MCF2673626.1 type IV secretion system protein [Fusobacterium varium]